MIHAYFVHPDSSARAARLGVLVDTQPAWHYKDGSPLAEGLGRQRLARFIGLRTLRKAGVDVAIHTDRMLGIDRNDALNPFNPFLTIYAATTRRTESGEVIMDAIHWALGHDAPLAVTAMGGKFVVEDNREIPDTLEVIWTYPRNTLVTFSQFNATAAPAARDRRVEIEFRGTKGTMYLFSGGYEIVPDDITPNEFPARTPVDRRVERGYRTGAKPLIQPERP